MSGGERDWAGWTQHPSGLGYCRYTRDEQGVWYECRYHDGRTTREPAPAQYQARPQTYYSQYQTSAATGLPNQASSSYSPPLDNLDSLRSALSGIQTSSRYAYGPRSQAYQQHDRNAADVGYGESVRSTNEQAQSDKRHISGSDDVRKTETLDPRYARVRNRDQTKFFKPGRVFAMLWTEPASQDNPNTRGSTHFSVVSYGEQVYSEIRRFIVVRQDERHSICVPIQTYSGRGVVGRGSDAVHHAIAYVQGTSPTTLPGESRMNKQAIAIEPIRHDPEALNAASRINFSKTYTVEHNVKVLDIGKVAKASEHLLDTYWRITNCGVQCANCAAYGETSYIFPPQRCGVCKSSA